MSEIVRNDVSTESLCTVIENIIENSSTNSKSSFNQNNDVSEIPNIPYKENSINLTNSPEGNKSSSRYSYSESEKSPYDTCDTSQDESNALKNESNKSSAKLKKSVSFDPQDEKVRKFIVGEPIVDQQNPFKQQQYSTWGHSSKKKKIPPPVPTKRSTLSVRKTVTQQLREREREKEKERERLKNETNNRKSNINGNPSSLPSPNDFITTEEVLNQSKYVKTYIKNPDPYFVYDPTILARLKFEELRDIADKNPTKKIRLSNQTRDRIKDLKSKPSVETSLSYSKLPFKKCSKPNYPDLSDIKIKVGTDLDGNYFNPAEVSKNAKKFDDRVKKLHISSDDDLDEMDCPLTKSESSDEVTANLVSNEVTAKNESETMDANKKVEKPIEGSFTNTIKSKEFQEYLEKKGLTLIPKKIPNGARPVYTNGLDTTTKSIPRISFKTPESVQISLDDTDSARNTKKPSVFQRLLSNSIFATRRKTTPKDVVPTPRPLYNYNIHVKENSHNDNAHTPMKRVSLERQSFHGRPHMNNLLSPAETDHLKHQDERSRKSFASGDNLSLSLSSVLTNAELNSPEQNPPTRISKPPRRTHSRERLGGTQQTKQPEPVNTILKPKAQRLQVMNNITHTQPPKEHDSNKDATFKRGIERQSLIPKRSTQTLDRREVFGRSASMDRNEILKKRLIRELQNKSKSDNETSKVSTPLTSRENIQEQFSTLNGPTLTSTPIRDAQSDLEKINVQKMESQNNKIYVDKQEWERLKALKDRMDKELYFRMLQEQKQQKEAENIYERVRSQKILIAQPTQVTTQTNSTEENFIRGSPQRNTFSGLTRNRQAKIIDGKALIPTEYNKNCQSTPRSQSVLDNMTSRYANSSRNEYGSEIGTPVILRRKDNNNPSEQTDSTEQRRIGGILTRDEILQKVKEFCRKSLNKTPTIQQPQIQAIHSKLIGPSDLSPVSYASVETNHRPGSRMYAAPQVPQRMQSLPQQFVPINTPQMINEVNPSTSSPIYAHVVKRSSLLSNQSEIYDSPQKPTLYVSRGSLPLPQYVLVDGDKLIPATQMISYYPTPTQNEIYSQPHYIRPCKLQTVPGAYGYISVREPLPKQQFRPRLLDGRSTPLILDNSSQQTSQIYWTTHNPRWQQHIELIPDDINSPRYMLKQAKHPVPVPVPVAVPVPVPAPRMDMANRVNAISNSTTPIQNQQSTITKELSTGNNHQQHQMLVSSNDLGRSNSQHPYEWESGSEAGEVQRILENPRISGESRTRHFLNNFKKKLSRLLL